jgi:hypothetical protein
LDSAGLTRAKHQGQAPRSVRSFGPEYDRGLHIDAAAGQGALQTRMLAPSVRLIALSLVGLVFLRSNAGPTLEPSQTELLVGVATSVVVIAVVAFTSVLARLIVLSRSTSITNRHDSGSRTKRAE